MKKRVLIALLLTSLTAATSFAADYPVTPRPYSAYPVGPLLPVEWTGLYFGVNSRLPQTPRTPYNSWG